MMICRDRAHRGRRLSFATSVAVAFLAATWLGCGSGGAGTSPVSGKVTYQGQPVTGGTLNFSPTAPPGSAIAGRPASGKVQSDGSFVLMTNKPSDGAVVGKHRVMYSPPVPEMPPPKELKPGESAVPTPTPPSPYDGLIPKPDVVEVTKGSNTISIELVPPAGAAPK